MAKIKKITASEILASGGAPSLEVTVMTEGGFVGEASVSYGASAGTREATVLLDGDRTRYNGKGMLMAIKNINDILAPAVVGVEVTSQIEIDEKMIALDGTENKAKLGGNAILGVSMAVARAAAAEKKMELYEYLRETYDLERTSRLPKPMIVMIEGGKHADKTTDLQEFCVSALGDRTAAENVRMEMEIYEALKKILKREKLSTNVGNEGAFAPNGIPSNEAPLSYLVEAMTVAGYAPGVDCGISLDAAASEFLVDKNADPKNSIYDLRVENKKLTSEELIEYYAQWIEKYPFVSWEDMLSEFDWESWPKLLNKINGKFPLIADDLTVTNKNIWQEAIDKKAANAILIKLNQAGSVSETIDCCKLAIENGMWTVPSHRGGGETNDTFMVDLAVAVGAEYIKCGPTRGERVCKYNRLMKIEDQIKVK
ncbi:MAG TPA: phosphopyruvate hydratase [Candidatus Woesebacteria bacterium]|nr:phosphopyruvate hydratase [Candidatus Woesebacteria bacterium]